MVTGNDVYDLISAVSDESKLREVLLQDGHCGWRLRGLGL